MVLIASDQLRVYLLFAKLNGFVPGFVPKVVSTDGILSAHSVQT